MKLLGLSGTNGAGKDSVAELLAREYNYLFISVSDLLRDELAIRGMTTERHNMRELSAEWRRKYGLGVLVDRAVEEYNSKGGSNKYAGLVVSSIRNPGEIDKIHELGGKLVWIDADAKIRYDRLFSRGREDDKISFKDFELQQEAEMQHSGDEATLSMGDVRDRADYSLLNEGSTMDELKAVVSEQLLGVL